MARAIRALAVLALAVAPLLGGDVASAADPPQHWFSFHTKELSAFDHVDAVDATARPLDVGWRFDIGGPAGWPATISTRTPIAPSRLVWTPALTPVPDGGQTVYTRSGTTGEFLFTVVRAADRESGSLRLATRRELVEGRAVLPGGPVGRTLRIEVTPAETGRVVQVVVFFSSPPGPVSVSDVACPGGRTDFFGPGSVVWDIRPPVAGMTSRFECTFRATNTSGGTANYMPQVQAVLLQGPDPRVEAGATRFAFASDPLGTTDLAVTPPSGVSVVGHLDQWEERRTVLMGENRGAPVVSWTALTVDQSRLNDPGDVVANAQRSFTKEWSEALFSPFGTTWPGEVSVSTARTDLTFFPAPSRTVTGSPPQYIWSTTTNGPQPRQTDGNATEDVGYSLRRSLSGGRQVDPGPASTRSLEVEFAGARSFDSVQISINFTGVGPVTASAISCDPATSDPPTTQMNWFLRPAAPGATQRITCSVTLTNSSSGPANYMPTVFVAAIETQEDIGLTPGATSVTTTDSQLGTIGLSVSPPTGTAVQGTLRKFRARNVFLQPENRSLPVQEWTASLSRLYSTDTPGDALVDGIQPLRPSWGFTILSFPVAWPAKITLTTSIPRAQLSPFPPVEPTTTGGSSVYTWTGMTPFFNGNVSGTGGLTIDADLGFGAERTLIGGRLVPAGSTGTRELVVRTRTSVPMISLSVAVETTIGAPPPVTVSNVDCPGSGPIGGSDGRSWRLDAPAIGVETVLRCTFQVTNSTDQDVSYMPWVNLWSSRSFTQGQPVFGATHLERSTELLGTLAYGVTPPEGTLVRGTTSTIDIRTATMNSEARRLPRRTAIEVLSIGTFTFGFEPPLEARLTNSRTGAALANKKVRFELLGLGGGPLPFVSPQVTTDADGRARFQLPFSPFAGTYTVRAIFEGDPDHLASSGEGALRIVNSIGKVTGGSIRDANNGRGGFNVQSDGTTLKGEFQFQNDALDYHASEVRALGISADGRRAVFAVVDASGTTARVIVEDTGEGGDAIDRIEIRIGPTQENGDGVITGGTIQIHTLTD